MTTPEYTILDKNCSRITHNGMYNYINESGDIISAIWFDECLPFRCGFGRVRLDKKWNYIDMNGKILCDTWFEKANAFYGEKAKAFIGIFEHTVWKNGKITN
jgi:hypothetical protein